MENMKEKTKKLLNQKPEFNFEIERNGVSIGKMQGIPADNQNYLHVISSTVNIEKGDCLINNLNQRFIVSKIEIISNNILRIHFSV